MSGDERFDRELRSALRGLAADPAPERLVQRVASIPGRSPLPAPRRSFARLVTALAAAAVLVLAGGLVIATRPGGPVPVGGNRPAGAATASPAPASQPAVAASTPAASAPTSAPLGPTGGPVPAGFQVVSATFVSPDLGWVLGTSVCSTPPCTAILRTADGGRTWTRIPAPATPVSPGPVQPGTTPGVTGLRFADPLDGWAFGPDLWVTHNGGATWARVTIPGVSSGAVVEALETSAGTVHAVLYDVGAAGSWVRLASGPVGSNGWTLSPTQVQIGAGPVPQAQLLLSGSAGWMVEVDRTVVGGARLVNGNWAAWTPPCSTVMGPAVLAASGPTEVVAACDGGIWGPAPTAAEEGQRLYASHNGGTTFAEIGATVPLTGVNAVASPAAGAVLAAGSTSAASALVGSFDGGRTWHTLLRVSQTGGQAATFTYLGFTTPTQGMAITQSGNVSGSAAPLGTGTLYLTRDGGRTWSPVAFSGQ
ncbi:MAG: hypothetical protein ACP5VP_11510 [Candidatus Limnocylindrales bacterium]